MRLGYWGGGGGFNHMVGWENATAGGGSVEDDESAFPQTGAGLPFPFLKEIQRRRRQSSRPTQTTAS